ncbi:MAG: 3'-5' exonuclease, partial [Opitutales bacterium]|nr:3'-5' exonuclease [Opitutales bacterium]
MTAPGPQIHVMDFEGNPRIGVIELGVVTLSAAKIVHTRSRFCCPDGEIPPAESRIHHISQQMVADSKPFAADFQAFVELRRSGIFAAHNATVEANLVRGQWPSPPIVPDWSRPNQHSADWGPWVDTLKIYRKLYPG